MHFTLTRVLMHHSLTHIQAKNRRLTCQLRETKKKLVRVTQLAEKRQEQLADETRKRVRAERLLSVARAQLDSFKAAHPDWKPPENVVLLNADHTDAEKIFKVSVYWFTCCKPLVHLSTCMLGGGQ